MDCSSLQKAILVQVVYLVNSSAYTGRHKILSDATKRLREEYLHNYMMRNWISAKLQKLNPEQVKKIYGMVKEWTGEEVDFKEVSS